MTDLSLRLKKGSAMLGAFWKAGDRACGWTIDCQCDTKTKFCQAKTLWLKLAQEDGRELSCNEFGIIEMMKASEIDSLGISVKVDLGGELGVITVGGNKSTIRLQQLWKLMRELPEVLGSTLQVMKAFPGALVEIPQKIEVKL